MAKLIEVPGYGVVEFPDEMSDEQIVAAIKNNTSKQPRLTASKMDQWFAGRPGADQLNPFDVSRPLSSPPVPGFDRASALTAKNLVAGGANLGNVLTGKMLGDEEAVRRSLERVFPAEETAAENTAAKFNRMLGGAAATMGMGGMATGGTGLLSQALSKLATSPGAQVIGGMAAEGVNQLGELVGAPWWATLPAAVLAGGVAPGVVQGVAQGGAAAGRALTSGGGRRLAAEVLGKSALNPGDARNRIERATQYVPGTRPTTGQLSEDPGLAVLEKTVRQTVDPFGAGIKATAMDNISNQARADVLRSMKATDKVIAALEKMQRKVAGPIRVAAERAAAGKTPDETALVAEINKIGGNTARMEARARLLEDLERYKTEYGGTLTAKALDEWRKEINHRIANKFDDAYSVLRNVAKDLSGFREHIKDQLEAMGPGWKGYLRTWGQHQKRIDQYRELRDTIGEDLGKVTAARPTLGEKGVMPDYTVSQAKLRAITANPDKMAELPESARSVLRRVQKDLDRAEAAGRATQMRGSDTAQNIAQRDFARMLMGDLAERFPAGAAAIEAPMGFMFRKLGGQERIERLVAEAMTDPKKAKELLDLYLSNPLPMPLHWSKQIGGGLLGAGSATKD